MVADAAAVVSSVGWQPKAEKAVVPTSSRVAKRRVSTRPGREVRGERIGCGGRVPGGYNKRLPAPLQEASCAKLVSSVGSAYELATMICSGKK